jgi:hypothetical protein
MSLSSELREQVRQRARCACEFCGVSETFRIGVGATEVTSEIAGFAASFFEATGLKTFGVKMLFDELWDA